MLISQKNFQSVLEKLVKPGQYGADTETTGLRRSDELFSIILADDQQGYYFNFNHRPDHLGHLAPTEYLLPRDWIYDLSEIFLNPDSMFFFHNAKFDLRMLAKEGVYVGGAVHCTEAMERVYVNNYFGHKPYSLASCAKRRGLAKDEAVDDYITKHKLFTDIAVPGKDKQVRLKHFDLVPLEIISPYGETDAVLTRTIGLDQIKKIEASESELPAQAPRRMNVVRNERKFTKACFRMEEHGVKINRPYVKEALLATLQESRDAAKKFKDTTGVEFENSADVLDSVFTKFGKSLPKTKTGKPCTNKIVLENMDHPVADLIREIRKPLKLASTYYSSFLYFADDDDIIHANFRQGGTETGRGSCSDPNMQNLPKEDEPEELDKKFVVRESFIPLGPEWTNVAIDFRQQEFRMMLDYAGEKMMISKINSGMDVHDATAELIGCTRKQAKTINFGLLYGMGEDKLARSLGLPLRAAKDLRADYFAKLPNVKTFINGIMKRGQDRGYIYNWFGFWNHFTPLFGAHVLPNHLIQGGCGQVLRLAIVQLDEFILANKLKSHIISQVHDELWFQIHESELDVAEKFKGIMEKVYKPKSGLTLECSIEHSKKSWAKRDMVAGFTGIVPPAGN